MNLGNKITLLLIIFLILIGNDVIAENKIATSPLINLDQIKPSYEESEEKIENNTIKKTLKEKKRKKNNSKNAHAVLIGLDKITAKSSEIMINLDETKKFGPLEIKILKCGKVKVNNKINDVAYMQVKDLTKNENEKVFIFNGWTFASDPNIAPFDHAIYDLQLLSCFNV